MSQLAVDGFRAERDAILTVARTLTADEWARPSACTGWSVRDVVGHMACTVHGVVDRAFLPNTPKGTVRGTEPSVVERRAWPVEAVIDEYETYSEQAGNLFADVQAAPLGDKVIPMADFGIHPMAILPSTYVFDAYTHLRNDILAPSGAIERPEPARDEMRLRPTVEWMLAVLPWMCADALRDVVDASITLALRGPGGGTWTIAPAGPDGRVALDEGTGTGAVATVRSTGHDFAMWGTRRTPWRDLVQIDGDEVYAARVLDAIDIY
jgi:uncharacterized protein (TIGR03083 family)